MTHRTALIAAAAITLMAGCCKTSSHDTFSLDEFRNPGIEYRAKPFWSLNDSLDTDEIRWQLEQFKEAGYGGAFLHSRIGLLTPYLSDEWFSYMDAGVKACQDLGLEAWFYDEDKWPSGFAGGIVPRQSDSFRAHTLIRVPAGTEINPEDTVLFQDDRYAYVDFIDRMGQSWYNGTCWVDLMNPEMVKAFLDCSYEPYIRRYAGQKLVKGIFSDEPQVSPRAGDYAGSDAVLPYSPCMEKPFREMWGYDLDPVLPSLLDTIGDWRRVRLHYYRTVAHCMETAFSAQIGNYCAEHDFMWTGHYNGEEMSSANMKNEGNLQHQLRNMQVPGVDALGLKYKNNHNDRVMTSVANQYGQRRRLVEIFGISGHNLSFEDRMWVTAWHTNSGANLMCPHLSLYSMKGDRKRDYPPTFSYHQPYWSQNRLFEDFSARLCYFATAGKTQAQACVISTIETDYIINGPKPVEFDTDTYSTTERIINTAIAAHTNIDIADEQVIESIGSVQDGAFVVGEMAYKTVIIPHLYTIRPSTLEKLVEFGKQGGRILVIKDFPRHIDGERSDAAAEQLQACATIIANEGEALAEALPESDIIVKGEGADKVMTHLREIKGGKAAQVSNTSRTESLVVEIALAGVPEGNVTLLLDPVSGACMAVDGTPFQLALAPAQSYVVLSCAKSAAKRIDGTYTLPAATTDVLSIPMEMKGKRLDTNALPLDFAECSRDGGLTWAEAEPVIAIYKRSQNEICDGPMQLRYSFDIVDMPQTIALAVEHPCIYSSVSVNGQELGRWGKDYFIDKGFLRQDIAGLVHEGHNEVILALDYKSPRTKSADAVERYGTEIETIYITGDFAVTGQLAADQPTTTWRNRAPRLAPKPMPARYVRGSLAITREQDSIEGNITTSGYPFYAGRFELETTFDLAAKEEGRRYRIAFPGVETILLNVTLNGKEVPTIFCTPWEADITDALAEGCNTLRITLTGSLRNLMGPYHNNGGEFAQVGPSTFIGGDEWPNLILGDKDWMEKRKTGTAKVWSDDYYSIPFGVLESPVLKVEL